VQNVGYVRHEKTNDADFIVGDSRNGWSALLGKVLKSYFETGESFTYSTILVRGYGASLKTFGGTASGPEVLIEGIQNISDILNARVGKKIRSIDALDIANIIGKIVVAGSARRSAQIAIGDPDDFLFLKAKNWGKGDIPAWRANSNNSIYADAYDEIIDEFWKGYDGSGEPYGLINRNLIRKNGRLGEKVNDNKVIGTNPCGEIGLEDGEPCNLAEIFLPNISSKEELFDVSALLYKTQKAITTLAYPYKKSQDVIERNRRLGQGITGWLQATEEQLSWVDDAYKNLKAVDEKWSNEIKINKSIKLIWKKGFNHFKKIYSDNNNFTLEEYLTKEVNLSPEINWGIL
jgi:adenosylcobalamin-dependent ribonucleoside-triphosphate reductase